MEKKAAQHSKRRPAPIGDRAAGVGGFARSEFRPGKGKVEKGRRQRPGGSGWFVGFASLVALILLSAIIYFLRPGGKPQPTAPTPVMEADQTAAPSDPADWRGPLPQEVASLFLSAETHGQRLGLIANPERDDLPMEAFFREGPGAKETVSKMNAMGSASSDTALFERLHVRLSDGGNRLLCVMITDDGGKVDFRSYSRYCSESWRDLLDGKAKGADEVRVFVARGATYHHSYSDDGEWSSYIATTPDLGDPLFFYAKRGTEQDEGLAEITGGGTIRATLAIRSDGESYLHRQFEVTGFLAAGWVR